MSPRSSSVPTSPAAAASKSSSPSADSTPPSSPPNHTHSRQHVQMEDLDETRSDHNSKRPGVSNTMESEEGRMQQASRKHDEERDRQMKEQRRKDLEGGTKAVDQKYKALEYLLRQSKLYSTIMLNQMQQQEQADTVKDERSRKKEEKREQDVKVPASTTQRRSTRHGPADHDDEDTIKLHRQDEDQQSSTASKGRGRGRPAKSSQKQGQGRMTDFLEKSDVESRAGSKNASVQKALEEEAADQENQDDVKPSGMGVQNLQSARQPGPVTGGVMRKYQLEGLEWLTSLYENGLNGILADEMGLGKTVQAIAFLAFLREKGTNGPFLIAAPLSTTSNWVDEFQRWTPKVPVILYHGSKQEREELRRTRLRNPGSPDFPVVCTSYEICMNDRKFLSHFGWRYIIVDEGHRIKNLNCRLVRELQSYQSANRLLMTGTPLQNNLAELWSLLHFLMPEIFDKLESFESWFDFSALNEEGGREQILSEERKSNVVTSLHAILKPFLLRRVKADVEHGLPKKREYVLFAPLTQEQRELYQEILHGDSRAYLENKVVETMSQQGSGVNTPNSVKKSSSSNKRKSPPTGVNGHDTATPNKSSKTSGASTPNTHASNDSGRGGRRAKKSRNYNEISDSQFFKKLEQHADLPEISSELGDSMYNGAEHSDFDDPKAATLALAKKQVAQKKLQNPVMQLRLCCNSPHNFYDPWLHLAEDEENDGGDHIASADYSALVTASGKMQLLDRLLRALLAAKANHKILLFSQFKSTLDLLALYLEKVLDSPPCRIDGSVPAPERQTQISLFNNNKHKASDHRIFLLSTRAGGQGINLAAADTVILFDSDWNPQQDLQAQDRAHRIGQTRNVVVYRFATRGTVEEMLLGKAEGKRRLEKLVIRKGKFKSWTDDARSRSEAQDQDSKKTGKGGKRSNAGEGAGKDEAEAGDALAELSRALGETDGTSVDAGSQLLSEDDLALLIDRSDAAYERSDASAQKGGKGGGVFETVETKREGAGGVLEGLSA